MVLESLCILISFDDLFHRLDTLEVQLLAMVATSLTRAFCQRSGVHEIRSDHFAILFRLPLRRGRAVRKTIKSRNSLIGTRGLEAGPSPQLHQDYGTVCLSTLGIRILFYILNGI